MNECCKKEENLKTLEKSKDKEVKQCVVCNRKHYEFTVDPVRLGIKLK